MTTLPIEEIIPELLAALRRQGRAVLQAPPGAGKTTRVPLAMLEAGLTKGKILMLEPRRLAARAAAERMAATLGQSVGDTVGYRMRGDSKVSPATRVEVLTEGILTRMIQSDPELSGVGALIFDEFHERSLNADLGLALSWEVRGALREDLILLVMSATLDAEPVARLLDDAPLVTSEGRSFPVDIHWLDRPAPKDTRFEHAVARLVKKAIDETEGGILVFLPGEGEIRRVQSAMTDLPIDVSVRPLFGAMPFKDQRAAIEPAKSGRKVVLATAIAETALTIRDIRVVVDAGRARHARFDPSRGMSRLVTERVTRAEAAQRTGRAGRVAPGVCYRMWTKGEDGAVAAFAPPEIEATDLSALVLELAMWGADRGDLALLTQPPAGAWNEAQALLYELGALGRDGRITDHGRQIAALPLHPRLAHMHYIAGSGAADMAALLQERDPLSERNVDLERRLNALRNPGKFDQARGALSRIAAEAKRLRRFTKKSTKFSSAQQAALAYPDRVGLRRKGDAPRWVLSGGTGVRMDESDLLANQRLLVVTDVDGIGRDPRIRQAIVISEAELRALYSERIIWTKICEWSPREHRVIARERECFAALVLDDRRWADAPQDKIAAAFLDGIRALGLPWSDRARRLQARALLVADGGELADVSDHALMGTLEDWLLPFIAGRKSASDIKSLDITEALRARLGWAGMRQVDEFAPGMFKTPLGRSIPVDYGGDVPGISVRLQEMFGVTVHPTVGPGKTPLQVTLLSPAGRPVQVTRDLPGFWASSYADVRKDMRGRYPKHPWPEDPTQADPTLRAKPRK